MAKIKIRHLIDQAIGFPETGHVNFSALHCLMIFMAEKLGISDDSITYDENENEKALLSQAFKDSRMIGGLNVEDNNGNENPNEPEAVSATQSIQENPEVKKEEIKEEISKEEEPPIMENIKEKPIEDSSSIPDSAIELPLEKLEHRLSKTELPAEDLSSPQELLAAISVLKNQLKFVIEQALLLSYLTLSKKPDFKQLQQLYAISQTLNDLKKGNINLKNLETDSLNWQNSEFKLFEEESNENDSKTDLVDYEAFKSTPEAVEDHLCYSPAKLLDQLMNLKSDFCLLTNKVNEISVRLMQQERQHLLDLMQDIQKQMRDVKLTSGDLRENHSRLEKIVQTNENNIENLTKSIEDITDKMVDKAYFELQMASKADYSQLQKKVSLEQLSDLQCRYDKKFSEIFKRFNESEKKFTEMLENLNTFGTAAIEETLAKFKENISKDIQQLNELLKNYIEATNDDCAAGGARVKVLHELACLSCDTNCCMTIREKAKVGKLPSAHASNILSPLITYELGSIRKSGLMGYYRKDDFPHSPNAWMSQQQSPALMNLKHCVPRHAGGQHTSNSARERHQKTTFKR